MVKLKNEVYLTPTEAAIEVGRAKQTVYQNWKSWNWTPFKYGSTLLFKQSELHIWLEKQIEEVA